VGTKSYMAPEIVEGSWYSGPQVDIFSMGVILFVMVVGFLPFAGGQANLDDRKYGLLCKGDTEAFWEEFEAKDRVTK
jgi:serine/threonine protein kinase